MRVSLRPYRELLWNYLGPQWVRVLLMAFLVLLGVGFQLLNPQILGYFIDTAVSGGAIATLLMVAGLFIGVALAKQAASIGATYLSQNVAWTATNRLRTDLLAHCLHLEMAFHKEHSAGELIERIDGDVDALSNFFSEFVVHLASNGILLLGVLFLLWHEDWRVGLAISLFIAIALVVMYRLRNYAVPFWVKVRQVSADFYGFLSEQLSGTEDIRANGATGYVMRRFYQFLQFWFPVQRKASLGGYAMWITTQLVFALGNALALGMAAYLWSRGEITLGSAYLIFYYTDMLSTPVQTIRNQLQNLQKAGASIARVIELLQRELTIKDEEAPITLPDGALEVVFDGVSFGYTPEKQLLDNLCLHIQPGKIVGVLGRTGSGKTTLVRLLLRLYDVQSGEVRVGGVSVREASLQNLRQRVGIVTQDVQLFQASVRDNLTLFEQTIPDEKILAVLQDVGLSGWYQTLPEGLDTELGASGEGLSAGQAQLLAFARVFLRNPGLVILDEASSRLDLATEQLIERAVSTLLQGRTGIMIAHRLATVQRADEIVIIEDGRIVEYGERSILAANVDSRFAQLLQAGLEGVSA